MYLSVFQHGWAAQIAGATLNGKDVICQEADEEKGFVRALGENIVCGDVVIYPLPPWTRKAILFRKKYQYLHEQQRRARIALFTANDQMQEAYEDTTLDG